MGAVIKLVDRNLLVVEKVNLLQVGLLWYASLQLLE